MSRLGGNSPGVTRAAARKDRAVSYRRVLLASLHDPPAGLDPALMAWADTVASERVEVEVELTGGRLSRGGVVFMTSTRALGPDAVWALFVEGAEAGRPVSWGPLGSRLDAGEPFLLEPGIDRIEMTDVFAIRNASSRPH